MDVFGLPNEWGTTVQVLGLEMSNNMWVSHVNKKLSHVRDKLWMSFLCVKTVHNDLSLTLCYT